MIIDELKNIDLYKSVIPKEIYDDIKTNSILGPMRGPRGPGVII